MRARNAMILASAVLAAALLSVGPTGAGAAVQGSGRLAKSPEAAARADRALLAHIPDEVRASCLLFDTSYNVDEPGTDFVAELECHPDPQTTISYRQYPTAADLARDFDRSARSTDPSCGDRRSYKVAGRTSGEWLCRRPSESDTGVEVEWTFTQLDVLARLDRTDDDVDAAIAAWTDDAGPDRAAHRVPAFVTSDAALRDGKALLAEIPDASAAGCEVVDLGRLGTLFEGASASPDFWLKAKVTCSTNGVPSHVDYRQYRNEDAYAAAYDAGALLRYSDDDDETCPGGYEASWKVGDQDVGRVACSLSERRGAHHVDVRPAVDRRRRVHARPAVDDRHVGLVAAVRRTGGAVGEIPAGGSGGGPPADLATRTYLT